MIKSILVTMAGICIAIIGTATGAQQLPKSGSISFHTGWKNVSEAITPAENHMVGHGGVVGTSFNDKGSGPLHLGPADCFYTFLIIEGRGTNKGSCAFGDADGDRIFTHFTGELSPDGDHGTNNIAGGTGKYAGITGSGPWKCKGAGTNGESQCNQQLNYRLP